MHLQRRHALLCFQKLAHSLSFLPGICKEALLFPQSQITHPDLFLELSQNSPVDPGFSGLWLGAYHLFFSLAEIPIYPDNDLDCPEPWGWGMPARAWDRQTWCHMTLPLLLHANQNKLKLASCFTCPCLPACVFGKVESSPSHGLNGTRPDVLLGDRC